MLEVDVRESPGVCESSAFAEGLCTTTNFIPHNYQVICPLQRECSSKAPSYRLFEYLELERVDFAARQGLRSVAIGTLF